MSGRVEMCINGYLCNSNVSLLGDRSVALDTEVHSVICA